MTILLAPLPIQSFRDNNGNPLAGGLLYTYQAGTSTLQSTYTDASGTTPNANPVVLNSRGEASVWLTSAQAFKLVLQDSYGVLIWSVDQVASSASSGANSDISSLSGLTTALSIAQGGTGAVTATAAATALGVTAVVDLAAPGGAGLVGHNATLNYAAGTIGSALNDTAINVKMFPWLAKFDGVSDDYPAIQAALNANVGTVILPKGVALVLGELDNKGKHIVGQGRGYTRILAGGAQRSVMKYSGQNANCEGIFFDGGNVATHCVYVEGANGSRLQSIGAERCKLDGVAFSLTGNNNTASIESSLIRQVGTTYATGTATTTAGGQIVTLTGAADLTTLGIRPNVDYIKVTGEPIGRAINSLTATTLSVYPPFTTAQAGATYNIMQGSCVYISRQGNNSVIKISNTSMQNAALAGIDDHALYGALSFGNTIETIEFGRIIGRERVDGNHEVVISSVDFGNYYEVNASAAVRLEYSVDAVVDPSEMMNGLNDISINVGVGSVGLMLRTKGEPMASQLHQRVNMLVIAPVWGETSVISLSAGSANAVVNLPVMPSGFNEKSLRSTFGGRVTLLLKDLSSNSVTVKSSDATINGIAGATGVVLCGNFRDVQCFFDGFTWTLTPTKVIQKTQRLNSGGGIAAGVSISADITGVDCTSASIQVSPYGGGEGTASDKYKVGFAVTARSSAGCTISLFNNGVSGQNLFADVTITT